jgi:UDP-N-acetyl-D-glucosamine dehydrogenase
MEILEARGAVADFHDPFVPAIPPTREHATLAGRRSVALDPEALSPYDAALIATDHDGIDYAGLVAACPLVIDTRDACRRAGIVSEKVVKA